MTGQEGEQPSVLFSVKRWIGAPYDSAAVVRLKGSQEDDGAAPQDVSCSTRGVDLVSV